MTLPPVVGFIFCPVSITPPRHIVHHTGGKEAKYTLTEQLSLQIVKPYINYVKTQEIWQQALKKNILIQGDSRRTHDHKSKLGYSHSYTSKDLFLLHPVHLNYHKSWICNATNLDSWISPLLIYAYFQCEQLKPDLTPNTFIICLKLLL